MGISSPCCCFFILFGGQEYIICPSETKGVDANFRVFLVVAVSYASGGVDQPVYHHLYTTWYVEGLQEVRNKILHISSSYY